MTDESAIAATLLELTAATLGECGAAVMAPRIRAAWTGALVAGRAFPVRCSAGDNLAIHVAVAEARAGSVLVVDVGGEPDFGYWGEVLTVAAMARGLRGLVIDGGVRDVTAIAGHGFPIFSATIALRGATKSAVGSVGAAVSVGGVEVAPGDWVVGDGDGVAVVPGGSLDAVVAASRERERREREYFERLRAGETTIDLLKLDTAPVTRAV